MRYITLYRRLRLNRILKLRRNIEVLLVFGSIVVGPIYNLMPEYSKRLMDYWPFRSQLGGIHRLMYRAVIRRALAEYYSPFTTSDRRGEIIGICMGGARGSRWTTRREPLFPGGLRDSLTMFKQLESYLTRRDLRTVHQIGCGSGREIAHFAQLYPHISFIGSDIDDAIIGVCRERWSHIENLSFTVFNLGLKNDTEELQSLKVDIVFASGCLLYLDEMSLHRFLRVLRTLTNQVLIMEVISIDYDMQEEINSSPYYGFAWNHNYTHCLIEEGWKNITWKVDMIEQRDLEQTISISAIS